MIRAIAIIGILLCTVSCGPEENAATNQAEQCTRATLQAAVDSYLAAQEAGGSGEDVSCLPREVY
jgi:hypothetical protein